MSISYVLVEQLDGRPEPVTLELITAARALGDVVAVVVGEPGAGVNLAAELGNWGAAQVVSAEVSGASNRLILPAVDALHILAANNPGPIVIAATARGNEIAGRLAARLASGVLTDVVGINADRTAQQSIFGDTIQVSAAVGGASPLYTLRPGALDGVAVPATGEWQPLRSQAQPPRMSPSPPSRQAPRAIALSCHRQRSLSQVDVVSEAKKTSAASLNHWQMHWAVPLAQPATPLIWATTQASTRLVRPVSPCPLTSTSASAFPVQFSTLLVCRPQRRLL